MVAFFREKMNHKRVSFWRITSWTGFLFAALLVALTLWYLPGLLKLDEFRPEVVETLEGYCHCKVLMGNIQGELLPSPGLVVGHVVFLEPTEDPRILASVTGVHLWLSWKSLLLHGLHFRAIRFWQPRFIVRREEGPAHDVRWVHLELPHAPVENQKNDLQLWEIRNGTVEIWDETVEPDLKYELDRVSGSYRVPQQTGAWAGRALSLGTKALLGIRYTGAVAYPLVVQLQGVELSTLKRPFPYLEPWLDGTLGILIKARLVPMLTIQAKMTPLRLNRLQGQRLEGEVTYENAALNARLQTVSVSPMTLSVEAHFPKGHWDLQANLKNYDASVFQKLYSHYWINLLGGNGYVTLAARSGSGSDSWTWTAQGTGFELIGKAFRLPEWTAQGDTHQVSLNVTAATAEGGTANVRWSKSLSQPDSSLDVAANNVTVRQIVEIFNLQAPVNSSSLTTASSSWKPYGYEPWRVTGGVMHALIHPGQTFEVVQSSLSLAGMQLVLRGTFDLATRDPHAHIQGGIWNVSLGPLVESFFNPPSPITGVGQFNFALVFPTSPLWVREMNGMIELQVNDGVLTFLKTFYRIAAVLNLGNYLRLRLPQVSARGILYGRIRGNLLFENGLMSSENLFLESPNLNIGVKGVVDLPGKRLKVRIRLELFRFLEDILRDVPITHWIFKKPNKIFLPLVVDLEGPWDNLEVQ
jgi:hypothetical protein